MNKVHVLLIENTPVLKPSLERNLKSIENARFAIESVDVRMAQVSFHFAKHPTDVVLLGDKIPAGTALRLAKAYRSQGHAGHVIALTRQSEARVSPSMRRAGIDDILNVMEVDTPVFGWTFMSALQSVGNRKKAEEYEEIQNRLKLVNNALEHFAQNMTGSLLGLHDVSLQLSKNGHSKVKPGALRQQLADTVAGMDQYLAELLDIRSRLGKETKAINKALAIKSRA